MKKKSNLALNSEGRASFIKQYVSNYKGSVSILDNFAQTNREFVLSAVEVSPVFTYWIQSDLERAMQREVGEVDMVDAFMQSHNLMAVLDIIVDLPEYLEWLSEQAELVYNKYNTKK